MEDFKDSAYTYVLEKEWRILRWNSYENILSVYDLIFHIPCCNGVFDGGGPGHCNPDAVCSCGKKPPTHILKKVEVIDKLKGYKLGEEFY